MYRELVIDKFNFAKSFFYCRLGLISKKGDNMYVDVEIVEGGRLIRKEKMNLKKVKEFQDGLTMYENEEGRSVLYSEKDKKYTLVSIDMA